MVHISDLDLLLHADGESTAAAGATIRKHLSECWTCRARKAELDRAIAGYVEMHHREYGDTPAAEGPRALLRARLAAEGAVKRRQRTWPTIGVAAALLMATGLYVLSPAGAPADAVTPDRSRTPGATRVTDQRSVCVQGESRGVTPATALAVFRAYGIKHPQPGSWEVDYLIPPALGGSDDRRNLWPQPYSSGLWNSRVKDALEDELVSLVCSGQLDLAAAQADLARDWVAAYKKYFRTDRPLIHHLAFVKDRPWE